MSWVLSWLSVARGEISAKCWSGWKEDVPMRHRPSREMRAGIADEKDWRRRRDVQNIFDSGDV